MGDPANNLLTAMRGMEVLKHKILSLGGQCLHESRPQNRLVLDIVTPANNRLKLRVKTMSKGGWQGTINDGDQNPQIDEKRFWVFIDLGQPTGHEKFYIAPEYWVKMDIFAKHKEYLERNGGNRVNSPNSMHHAIKVERVVVWESRWDLLGLSIKA